MTPIAPQEVLEVPGPSGEYPDPCTAFNYREDSRVPIYRCHQGRAPDNHRLAFP